MPKYNSIEEFRDNQPVHIRKLLNGLEMLILNTHPKIQVHFQIGTPLYKVRNDICYIGKIHPVKGVELCFMRGFQLSNAQGLLQANGRKFIHGILLKDMDELNDKKQLIVEILQEALILDEMHLRNVFTDMLQGARKKKS